MISARQLRRDMHGFQPFQSPESQALVWYGMIVINGSHDAASYLRFMSILSQPQRMYIAILSPDLNNICIENFL